MHVESWLVVLSNFVVETWNVNIPYFFQSPSLVNLCATPFLRWKMRLGAWQIKNSEILWLWVYWVSSRAKYLHRDKFPIDIVTFNQGIVTHRNYCRFRFGWEQWVWWRGLQEKKEEKESQKQVQMIEIVCYEVCQMFCKVLNPGIFFTDVNPYLEGVGVHGPKGRPPPDDYRNVDDEEAINVGLQSKWQIDALRNYLWANHKLMVKPVRKQSRCLQ